MSNEDIIKKLLMMQKEAVPLEPLDPEEFCFACSLAFAAGAGVMPIERPSKGTFRMKMPDGKIEIFAIKDTPEAREASAIYEHYGKERLLESFNAATRYAAIRWLMMTESKMKSWIVTDEEQAGSPNRIFINDAILETMATFPIDSTGIIDAAVFFKEVRHRHKERTKASHNPTSTTSQAGD